MTAFKAEYAEVLPVYTGKFIQLPGFLSSCERFVDEFYDSSKPEDDFPNLMVLAAVRNRIRGEAAAALLSFEIDTWEDLKKALITSNREQRDLVSLVLDLCRLRQGRMKPLEFFGSVWDNFSRQVAYVRLHWESPSSGPMIEFLEMLAIRSLFRSLNHPLGMALATKNPKSMDEAHRIVREFPPIHTGQQSGIAQIDYASHEG